MLGGQKFSFDDEAERLYDARPPKKTESEFQAVLDELDRLLPGKGSLVERYSGVPREVRHPDGKARLPSFAPPSTAAARRRWST